jgi:ABC-2 type transport system ATP-binding protein/lipopolysaccharide transport system ATP-binding protein
MTASAAVIDVQNVSLCYRLARQRIPSFKEYALHWVRGALTYQELWALRDVTLQIRRGETVGIVGRNGAGKSTLLKVISRILKPTQGSAVVHGSLAPILELGTGFDYELTGIENLYLNALLLGHTRREVDAKVDEIVEFSGLGDFVHSPVRNYSSGMVARLGFAVITAWIPDVLILDEVLAVGDEHFVKRCQERIANFQAQGAAVLLVSHAAEAVRKNCERCVWLDHGRVLADGPPSEVLARYHDAGPDAPRAPTA